jgi:hypothetical protein
LNFNKQELPMTRKLTLAVCILVSTVTASGLASAVTFPSTGSSVLIASDAQTKLYAVSDRAQQVKKAREFHDMGASGVQQIDYVVNCGNQTMAMSGFQIHTAQGSFFPKESIGAGRVLNFYAPVIEHDKQIAANVCGKLMALNGYSNN